MGLTDLEFRIIAECQMKLQLEGLECLPVDYYSDFYNEITLKMDIPLVDVVAAIIKFGALPCYSGDNHDH